MRVTTLYAKEVLRYVENELYTYPWRKQDIERLRADIMGESPERTERMAVGSENIGDPTLSKTVRLLTSRRLIRMTENYEAITRVYERLDKDKKRLVEMRYWQREYTDYGIYQRLHISRRTYYRWREQILWAIAVELGLL